MFFVLVIAVLLRPSFQVSSKPARLEVEQGWLEGEKITTMTGDSQYYSFKGVSYAAPPLGRLRFMPPSPPLHWNGTRLATEHGSVCTQLNIFTDPPKLLGSEDCLFVNVYSPNLNPETLQAVMVFIHGGGYESDSGNDDVYGPDFLVQFGVVLVTFNYRLDALGFLSLESKEVPGNAGLKDQVAALKWVKRNIKRFGGNPDEVTVFGQSAGAASVVLHMASKMSKGLFKRAISMSGVPSCDWSLSYEPRRRAFVLGKELGFNTNDEKELLEYLKSVPAEKLVGTSPSVLSSEDLAKKYFKIFHFTPVTEKDFGDEHFVVEDYRDVFKTKQNNDVGLLIGHTNEETLFEIKVFKDTIFEDYAKYAELLVPRKILYTSAKDILKASDAIKDKYFGNKTVSKEAVREFLNYFNDASYNYDIYNFIQLFSKASESRIYVYKFSAFPKRNILGNLSEEFNIVGASHLDDIFYLFNSKQNNNFTGTKASQIHKKTVQICELFTNFAKYGNPTPHPIENVTWPAYNEQSEAFLEIGDQLRPGKALDKQAAKFWNELQEQFPSNIQIP